MTDVLVIGGGPGGTPLAMALAQAGREVTLVEAGPGLGGTCLFEGCIPSKIFRETARRLRELQEAGDFGLCLPSLDTRVDWSAVQRRKRAILERRSLAALMRARTLPTLEVIRGRARFLSPRSAHIDLAEGGERTVEFQHAVIATGSAPFRPPIPGIEHGRVMDSEEILKVDEIPERLTCIGGGPIGVELGQVFHALGSQVTILEMAPRILGPVDEELAERLEARMREDGIEIITGCQVEAIANTGGDGVYVEYSTDGEAPQRRFSNAVLLVTGRRPRVEGLGLETTAVRHGPHGIEVSSELETAEPGIFAVGDVVGHPMFAHWATAQGLALARRLLGRPTRFPDPDHNSAVIFSAPEVGMAGLTEAQAKARGLEVEVARYDFSRDARAQIAGRDSGMLKLVYERGSRRVLGVHVLEENAGEIMGEAALLVQAGLPIEAVAASIHPHPTLTESFGLAARSALATAGGNT